MSVLVPLLLVLASLSNGVCECVSAECGAAEIDAATLLQSRIDTSIKQEENGRGFEHEDEDEDGDSTPWPQSGNDNERCALGKPSPTCGVTQLQCQEFAIQAGVSFYNFDSSRGCCKLCSEPGPAKTETQDPWKIFGQGQPSPEEPQSPEEPLPDGPEGPVSPEEPLPEEPLPEEPLPEGPEGPEEPLPEEPLPEGPASPEEPSSEEPPSPSPPEEPLSPKMTDFQMEKFQLSDPTTRCKGSPPNGWGNYGNHTVDSECANACLRDPSCKFAGIDWTLWSGGKCTQFASCDKVKETKKELEMGGDGKMRCHSSHQTCYWWFWKKVPAPAPVPLPPPPAPVSLGDPRRWDILPGEVVLSTTAPDGISAGCTETYCSSEDKPDTGKNQCWMKYTGDKCLWQIGGSQKIPVEKHGDPKGVDWCAKKSNGDSKKDLCDQVQAKYDEVEQLEASLHKTDDYWKLGPNGECTHGAYINVAWLTYKFEHSTQLSRSVNQDYYRKLRNCKTKVAEINEKLSKALGELVALNDKVVG